MAKKKPSTTLSIYQRVKRGFLHVFIPHSGNAYHPHLIRPLILITVMSVAVGLYSLSQPAYSSVKGVATAGLTSQALLTESNTVRSQNNVPTLAINEYLNKAAELKAQDMLTRQYWAHNAPDGTTPWYWFREVDYDYNYAGENLAKGFETPQGVVIAWMNCEEHRKNALNPQYQEVGFGVVNGTLQGTATTVVVALYGSPARSTTAEVGGEVLAASDGNVNPITQFGIGIQSMNPTMIGAMTILTVIVVVALSAYTLRNRLPRDVRKNWQHHHALYKAIFTGCLILILIALYGNGQIL